MLQLVAEPGFKPQQCEHAVYFLKLFVYASVSVFMPVCTCVYVHVGGGEQRHVSSSISVHLVLLLSWHSLIQLS